MTLTWLDWAFLAVLAITMLTGFMRGLVREALGRIRGPALYVRVNGAWLAQGSKLLGSGAVGAAQGDGDGLRLRRVRAGRAGGVAPRQP